MRTTNRGERLQMEIVGSMLIGRTTSRDSLWLVELLIVRLLDTQSHTTGGATTCDWWYDHTRLVLRPYKTCLRLVIAALKFWTWPSTLLRLILLVRSPTTTTISGTFLFFTIWQQFQHFSVVTWSQVWCDCGYRRHDKTLSFGTENES